MLSGKKTYLVAGAMALVGFAKTVGWLDEDTYQAVFGLLGALGLTTLRAGVTKSGSSQS